MAEFPEEYSEKTGAELVSNAGNILINAIKRIVNSYAASISVERETFAIEYQKNKSAEGKMERKNKEIEQRRIQENREIDHKLELALRYRATERILGNAIKEQLRIEHIRDSAIEEIEKDPDNAFARDIDDDWLGKFFKYAAEVTNEQVVYAFTKALSNAAINTKQRISTRSLDLLRFFNKKSFDDLLYTASKIAVYGYCNEEFLSNLNKDLDLELLIEMDVLKYTSNYHAEVQIGAYNINFSYGIGTINRFDAIKLTKSGREIVYLFNKEIETLENLKHNWQDVNEYWLLQKKIGIDQKEIEILANRVLSEIWDCNYIGISIKKGHNGIAKEIARRSRVDRQEEFNIKTNEYIQENDAAGFELFDIIIDCFERFDKETLPVIGDRTSTI